MHLRPFFAVFSALVAMFTFTLGLSTASLATTFNATEIIPKWNGPLTLTTKTDTMVIDWVGAAATEPLTVQIINGDITLTPLEYVTESKDGPVRYQLSRNLDIEVFNIVMDVLVQRSDIRWVSPVLSDQSDGEMIPGNAIMFRLTDGTEFADVRSVLQDLDVTNVQQWGSFKNAYRAELAPNASQTVVAVSNILASRADQFRYAHPDFYREMTRRATAPDPLYSDQWYLKNTGQLVGIIPGNDINVEPAWDITLGSSDIRVCVIDSGVDTDHPELAGRFLAPFDALDGVYDFPEDPDGHGTSCAGIILASQDTVGVTGIAPNSLLIPVRLIPIAGSILVSQETSAFAHAFANESDIVSNSWGGASQFVPLFSSTRDEFENLYNNGRDGRGSMIFWAAGNSYPQTCDPDEYVSSEFTIAVGASNERGERSFYSETGLCIDLSAPSNGGIWGISTLDTLDNGGSGYEPSFGGTSAACPTAAGVAALMLAANEDLTNRQALAIMKLTAEQIGEANEYANGESNQFGAGRVDAGEAVAYAVSNEPVPSLTFWGIALLLTALSAFILRTHRLASER